MADWCTGVDCSEVAYSIQLGYSSSGVTLSVDLNFPGDQLADFIDSIGVTANPVVPTLKCVDFTIKPLANSNYVVSGQALGYDFVTASVRYEGKIDNSAAATESVRPWVEMIPLPIGAFKWASGRAIRAEEAQAFAMRGVEIVRTLNRPASIPAAFFSAAGKCNSEPVTFTTLGLTCPAETLLFAPNDFSTTYNFDGTRDRQVSMAFRWRPISWNKFFNGDTGQWETINLANGGAQHRTIETADLSGLVG